MQHSSYKHVPRIGQYVPSPKVTLFTDEEKQINTADIQNTRGTIPILLDYREQDECYAWQTRPNISLLYFLIHKHIASVKGWITFDPTLAQCCNSYFFFPAKVFLSLDGCSNVKCGETACAHTHAHT